MPKQNTLHLAVCSNLRRDLMISLKERKKPLSELRDELGVSSTTAIHALRDLEKGNLIFQDEIRDYALTKIGEIVALKLSDFLNTIEVLQKYERFWCEHDLSDIPPPLLERIGYLRSSMPLMGTPTDIFKLHTTFLRVLETANKVKGIYPIFNIEYLTTIEKLVKGRKVDVELIVTNEVLDSIEGMIESEETFKDFLHEPSFTLFATDKDVKITLTLTDSVFYLGLFDPDGIYDYNRALISDDEKALSWGRALHEHYRQHSEVVNW
jgi:predicted transcriptional regulator